MFAVRTASDPPPLVILDDLHAEVDHSTYTLSKMATRLLDFLCEMKNEQLLNVLAISSEARTMREIIQNSMTHTHIHTHIHIHIQRERAVQTTLERQLPHCLPRLIIAMGGLSNRGQIHRLV
jgi:hypothetical protein